jgi:hypothetical protein
VAFSRRASVGALETSAPPRDSAHGFHLHADIRISATDRTGSSIDVLWRARSHREIGDPQTAAGRKLTPDVRTMLGSQGTAGESAQPAVVEQ